MMKKVVVGMFICLLVGTGSVFAQKFGHIDSQQLLAIMPETATAQADLETEAKQLENAMEEMEVEYNKKLQDYYAKADSLAPLVRADKEEELQTMMQRIQNFRMNAQSSLEKKQQDLFQPIMDKAQEAIDKVATDNGYTYIFDVSAGAILFVADDSEDILPLVKKQLGIQQ